MQQEQYAKMSVYYSHTQADKELRDQIAQRLKLPEPAGTELIEEWHEDMISPGAVRKEVINRAINTAHLILLLVSADYLASPACLSIAERAMERKRRGEALVVPIILKPCNWQESCFGELEPLPRGARNGATLSQAPDREAALHDISRDLRQVIQAARPSLTLDSSVLPPASASSAGLQPEATAKGHGSASARSSEFVIGANKTGSAASPGFIVRPNVHRAQRPNSGYAFGVDIGRSHLGVYLANLDATILDSQIETVDTEKTGGETCISLVAEILLEMAERHHIRWESVRGVGIGLPGIPNDKGYLVSPPLMESWFKLNIPRYLKQKLTRTRSLHMPVLLNNDANLGALAEGRVRRLTSERRSKSVQNLIYIKLGTGIGAGLLLNGELYRGSRGAAGEFGHVLIEHETAEAFSRCVSCGKIGCLESLAGERAILEDARSHGRSDALNVFPKESIKDLIEAAKKGEQASSRALDRAGSLIGRAIGSFLINVFDPSLILLDGSVIRDNDKLFTVLRRSAVDSSLKTVLEPIPIEMAHLGDRATAYGAIVTVLEYHKRIIHEQ